MRIHVAPAIRSAACVLVLATSGGGAALAAGPPGAATPIVATSAAADAPPTRAVLVTGASTGIGRRITERLAAHGFLVYATARKDADLEALQRIPNVRPLRMDVTRDADVAAAVAAITQAGHGLHGLVNNAGVAAVGSPIPRPRSSTS